jgi:GTP cyclohydrolase IIa
MTLFQLDDYGPWTTTPTPRREMDLQTLQSQFYTELTRFVGNSEGYAFYTRADNMLAVTNGIDRATHESIQTAIRNRYPVTLSISVGVGSTPRVAVGDATNQLQAAGSAQDETRTGVCRGSVLADPDPVRVAHFDVINATDKFTDKHDAFSAYLAIERAYGALAERLYQKHDGVTFFLGGDNIIAICPQLAEEQYERLTDYIRETAGVDLRVGVGEGLTVETAGMAAKHGLEAAREHEQTIGQVSAGSVAGVGSDA